MKTISIAELEVRLSTYLHLAEKGEEVVICDRDVPVARLLPVQQDEVWANEAELVASGAMTLPKKTINWDEFFSTRTAEVPQDVAVAAVIEGRGDR